ncbi:helix-turn-helix domain-containing protein [Streptomyces sp. NPDC094149]|uniref:AraC-like ligand-binding domain-containing protein n=1 Tax=Streptomyces sp. NPDC094149 TaxID=3155079 RepID=UPI00331C1AAD
MIGTLFHSENVPVQDRFDCWRELVGRTRSSEVISRHVDDFHAEHRLMELGSVTVWSSSFLPARFRRNARMVRQSDPELLHLSLLLHGELALVHSGQTHTFKAGDIHVVSSSQPYDLQSADAGHRHAVQGIGVDIPTSLLPLPQHRMNLVLGRSLPAHNGLGALTTQFLTSMQAQADLLQPADAPRLGTVVVDLVSAWLAHVLEAEAALPPETRQRTLARRIQTFIQHNLHDPDLTPPVIAAAHHISLSYLHKIAREHMGDEPVATSIRRRRLEAARRDLADPTQRTTPIHVIAARWGIVRASDFTRSFRAAYGLSPKDYRHRALSHYP